MDAPTETSTLPPSRLCGYRVVRVLSPGRSYLALGQGLKAVVLKQLESDCILRGQLHPSIKERLSRVRELAHPAVANLYGVERDPDTDSVYLVWEFIEGKTFKYHCADAHRTPRELLMVARELALALEGLHAQGIIHGGLHGRNIVIDQAGRLRLTHISPLLFNDADQDTKSIVELLRKTIARRGETKTTSLGDLLSEPETDKIALRQLRSKLAAIIESREELVRQEPDSKNEERRVRKRALFAAGFTTVAAVVGAVGVWLYAHETTSQAPSPMEASPAAMRTTTQPLSEPVEAADPQKPTTAPAAQVAGPAS